MGTGYSRFQINEFIGGKKTSTAKIVREVEERIKLQFPLQSASEPKY